jgi:hypothetical protein
MAEWYEQDGFWETMPMFTDERWAAAPQEVEALLSLLAIEPSAHP